MSKKSKNQDSSQDLTVYGALKKDGAYAIVKVTIEGNSVTVESVSEPDLLQITMAKLGVLVNGQD